MISVVIAQAAVFVASTTSYKYVFRHFLRALAKRYNSGQMSSHSQIYVSLTSILVNIRNEYTYLHIFGVLGYPH